MRVSSSLVPALFLLGFAWPSVAPAAPQDPLEILWGDRLDFADDGSPRVTVRIDEGEEEIALVPKGAMTISTLGKKPRRLRGAAGETWRFRVRDGGPARLLHAPQVADFDLSAKDEALAALERWRARGYAAQSGIVGGVYGIAGRILDNRRYAILLMAPGERAEAEALAEDARGKYDEGVSLYTELAARPRGTIEIVDPAGKVVASSPGAAVVEVAGDVGIQVLKVEHDMGYANHGRQDRVYRGQVFIAVDAGGKTAAVSVLPMEELLRGIVPSEIFATAHSEALQAQAVAARGEVLAKIGARHRGDPYLLCAEQHCQVYKGRSGEHPRTDQAIAASRGEVLFGHGGRLVDSVYSSTCGGHTENNEFAWGTPPNPNLRGVPDWIGHPELGAFEAAVEDVEGFLAAEVPGMCQAASFSRADKFRWLRRFPAAELDAIVQPLGIGEVVSLQVGGRGVSGRATSLAITGTSGAKVIEGELTIRRLLKNLNSSLFVIEREGAAGGPATAWTFRGGGWGHGVGMCQMGAIGRAELGHDHGTILRHYYSGAELLRLY